MALNLDEHEDPINPGQTLPLGTITHARVLDLEQFKDADGTFNLSDANTAFVTELKKEMRVYLETAAQYLAGPVETFYDIREALDGARQNIVAAEAVQLLATRDFRKRPEVAAWYAKVDAEHLERMERLRTKSS